MSHLSKRRRLMSSADPMSNFTGYVIKAELDGIRFLGEYGGFDNSYIDVIYSTNRSLSSSSGYFQSKFTADLHLVNFQLISYTNGVESIIENKQTKDVSRDFSEYASYNPDIELTYNGDPLSEFGVIGYGSGTSGTYEGLDYAWEVCDYYSSKFDVYFSCRFDPSDIIDGYTYTFPSFEFRFSSFLGKNIYVTITEEDTIEIR